MRTTRQSVIFLSSLIAVGVALSAADSGAAARLRTQAKPCKAGFVKNQAGRCVRKAKPKTRPKPPKPPSLIPVISVNCAPDGISVGQPTTCTAIVTTGTTVTPTGNIHVELLQGFTSDVAADCPLSPGTAGTSSCSVSLTPSKSGALQVRAVWSQGEDSGYSTLNVNWWPTGYTLWTGYGTGNGVVAYTPGTCTTLGGETVPNGGSDPFGHICFSYIAISSKDCLADIYFKANLIQNGIVVGYTNDLESVAAGQLVNLHSIVYGHAGASLQLTEISCN